MVFYYYLLVPVILIFTYFIYNHFDYNYINHLSAGFARPILNSIPKNSLYAITGNMLGDGSLSLSRPDKGKGKFSMTMDIYSLNYLHHLDQSIYSQFTETKIYPYPNILLPPGVAC